MPKTKMSKTENIEFICNELLASTNFYLSKIKENSGCFSFISNWGYRSDEIVISLLEMLESRMSRMDFPQMLFNEENEFLDELNQVYKKFFDLSSRKVVSGKRIDVEFFKFFSTFSISLKSILQIFLPAIKNIDLRNIEYYISCREIGEDDFLSVPLLTPDHPVKKTFSWRGSQASNDDCYSCIIKRVGVFSKIADCDRQVIEPDNDIRFGIKNLK